MHTSSISHKAANLDMIAALAEAWHVDGYFAEAIAGWETLALAGYERAESALKAAISCFSSGEDERGWHWLHLAEEAGTSAEEILYVRAQYHWQKHKASCAIKAFREAEHAAPHLSKASNALGVLYWQLGWTRDAYQQFTQALQRDPCDGEAMVNQASFCLRAPEGKQEQSVHEVRTLLERAASLQPHRAEAFVWGARLFSRLQETKEAREALGKARLRSRFCGPLSITQPAASNAAVGKVHVRGDFSIEQACLTLRYTCTLRTGLPTYVATNKGYHRVEVEGVALDVVPEEEIRQHSERLPQAPNIVFYRLPACSWRPFEEDVCLEITVEGRPVPPCITLNEDEIELDGRSGWLPLLIPSLPLYWQLEVQFPGALTLYPSSDEPEYEAIGLIALRRPLTISLAAPGEGAQRINSIAREDSPLQRLAPLLVQRTLSLWEEQVGPLHHSYPDVIIVDQPGSLFCYARRNYLRLPSGLARQIALSAQVCHEVGHLWWGLDVRFALADAWLGEALAEYSLHLAEDAGWLTDYRKNALTLLRAPHQKTLPAQGLAKLHQRAGKHAAYILRIKGGFLLAMLRTVMGDDAFWKLLRTCHAPGTEKVLDAYQFFALASRQHGSSLNWFANQWVYTDTSMAFSIEDSQLTRHEDVWFLTFKVCSRGVATPGGPVTVAIQCEGATEIRVPVNLNLGSTTVSVTLPTSPKRVIVDPDLRWYAEQGSTIISGESLYESERPSNLAHCSRNY